jgi:DNA polymerase V
MSQIPRSPISRQAIETLSEAPCLIVQSPASHRMRLMSHRLSAGFPSPAADYAEDGLDLNDYLVRNKPASFMFTVKGDSMMNAGIVEGDKVIVDRSINAKSKDIVVAVVNGEYTIKRLYKTAAKVELRPENPAYQPIVFQEGSELEIWGVVVGVVRRYGNQS